MKLTDRILLACLREEFTITRTERIGSSGRLDGPMLFDSAQELEEGWVYLCGCQVDQELCFPGSGCLLVSCVPQRESFSPGCAFVCLEGTVSRVLRCVSHAYARYAAWERELEKIQFGLGSVEEMLRASLPILQNPLLLFRSDLTMQTCVSGKVHTEEVRAFLTSEDHMEAINAMLQDENYKKNRNKTGAFWGPDYIVGFPSLNWNVRKNGDITYCLSVAQDGRRLTEADGDLLEALGFYVKYALYNRSARGSRRDENLRKILVGVLTDRTLDYMEASRQLKELDWEEDQEYLCLVYQLTYLDKNALPSASICNYMEEQYPCCSSFPYGSDIVTFFNLSISERPYEEILIRLKPFIRDSYLKAGFSRLVRGHMNLRRQYVQASIALDVGSRRSPYVWIHYFDQNAMPYILEQVTRKLPAGMICHEGLLRLAEHDAQHGTGYVETLRTYLDTQQNAVRSARALFIHRSTFLYRMEKIREILDSDLEDAEELLYLSLSLRLLESREKSGRIAGVML